MSQLVAEAAQETKNILVKAIDEDTNAFNEYMAALRLPAKTDAEKNRKKVAIQAGLKRAITVAVTAKKVRQQWISLRAQLKKEILTQLLTPRRCPGSLCRCYRWYF